MNAALAASKGAVNGTACPSALTPFVLGLKNASTVDNKLLVIRKGAETLYDDPGAIDHLHDVAVDIHDLPVDAVVHALADGITDAEKRRMEQVEVDRRAN